MRLIIGLITFIVLSTVPAWSRACDGYEPYYHLQENGPGALIADIFLFSFSLPAATAVAPLAPRALCMPAHSARHFFQNRPKQPKERR